MSPPLTLDQIYTAAQEAKRQEQQRQSVAQMADEIEKRRIEEEDWQPPIDVDANYVPEEVAPADWWIREQLAKELAKGRLAEEPANEDSHGYTIYVEDTD